MSTNSPSRAYRASDERSCTRVLAALFGAQGRALPKPVEASSAALTHAPVLTQRARTRRLAVGSARRGLTPRSRSANAGASVRVGSAPVSGSTQSFEPLSLVPAGSGSSAGVASGYPFKRLRPALAVATVSELGSTPRIDDITVAPLRLGKCVIRVEVGAAQQCRSDCSLYLVRQRARVPRRTEADSRGAKAAFRLLRTAGHGRLEPISRSVMPSLPVRHPEDDVTPSPTPGLPSWASGAITAKGASNA